jgi:hypothetical protein
MFIRQKEIFVFLAEELLCTQCSSPLYVMGTFPQDINLAISCAIFRQAPFRVGYLLLLIQPDGVSLMMQNCSILSFFCSFILLFPLQCTDIRVPPLLTWSVAVFLPFFLINLLRLFQILQIFIFSFLCFLL